MTRRVLLRCDSMGDLYPSTTPSLIPHVFLVSQHTWHQRLGHPGSDVLRRLVSNNFISCNKEKPLVLCHACQLHIRLSFVSSDIVVTSCFDIIHSECDHGGEFDNRNLHKLFAKNGIQFRFSCPKMSQQNVLHVHVIAAAVYCSRNSILGSISMSPIEFTKMVTDLVSRRWNRSSDGHRSSDGYRSSDGHRSSTRTDLEDGTDL
nr:ribonuclease H-like domain-containing protein [Tanacetum cinerariifolium]